MPALPDDFTLFFRDLKKNNHKEWFDENRDRYETFVKTPFRALVKELMDRIAVRYPHFNTNPSKAIFRINRDIRFSKNKQPYKLNVAAVFNRAGTRDESGPGFYLHLGDEELFTGGGMYMPDKEQLYKIRQEILYNHSQFKKATSDASFRKWYGEIRGERNKVLQEPFKEFVAEEPQVALKQFYYFSALSKNDLKSENLSELIYRRWEASFAMHDFLQQALSEG